MGRIDIELNNKGISQAYIVKNNLENEWFNVIFSSPLRRAKKTSEIINEGRNLPIIYDDRLLERSYGELEGKLKTEIDYNKLWDYNKNIAYAEIEPIENMLLRVYDFLNSILVNHKYDSILIVSHSGIGRIVDCYFNGIPKQSNLLWISLKNCEYKKYIIKR